MGEELETSIIEGVINYSSYDNEIVVLWGRKKQGQRTDLYNL